MSQPTASPLSLSLKKLARRPSFVLVCVVLLVAAVSINASVEFLQLHFQKQPVELRQELGKIPDRLGPWVQVSKDEPLPVDELHSLGTEKYVYRAYADSRLISAARLAAFAGKDYRDRNKLIDQLIRENPNSIINVGLTYYTGLVDTVAHIPERCYIAGGYQSSSHQTVKWRAFENRAGRDPTCDARMITFEDQSSRQSMVPRTVAYFFHCNGQYESDPIGVRKTLGNLFERFGYYAKVELMMQLHDGDAAGKIMDDFLSYALPEVEKCLPDWKSVTAKKS